MEFLADLLRGHIGKGNAGNFEDIANLAMMLHQRGADPAVLSDPAPVDALVKAAEAHGLLLVPKNPTRKQCIAFAEIAIRNVDYDGPWDDLIESIGLALPALAALRGDAK